MRKITTFMLRFLMTSRILLCVWWMGTLGRKRRKALSSPVERSLSASHATTFCEVVTMASVARITHYAYLGDTYGTAELVNGSGYLFREEGERQATLVSYKDPELQLLGLCDVADMQQGIDMVVGGYAQVACSREEGRQ
jgi:hypothetical protein